MIYWSSLESELSDDLSDITPISSETKKPYTDKESVKLYSHRILNNI